MKKIFLIKLLFLFFIVSIFAQSQDFNKHMEKAKEYESQKKWCHALGEYYEAMGTDDSVEIKDTAYEAYNNLADTIRDGKPGFGTFNEFTTHDEWKNLLIDAEIYGSTHDKYELWIGNLQREELDYANRTATYSAKIFPTVSYKWLKTICVVKEGYEKAYKEDWKDLPKVEGKYSCWPREPVSMGVGNEFDINGALFFRMDTWHGTFNYNAFDFIGEFADYGVSNGIALYDYKFNIVDETGKELVKGKRWLMGTEDNKISFSGITPTVMELIDNGKTRINLLAEYLEYGLYNSDDSNGGRTFIKNSPEKEVAINKSLIHYYDVKKEDKVKAYLIQKKNYLNESKVLNLNDISDDLFEIVMGGMNKKLEFAGSGAIYPTFKRDKTVMNDLIFVNRLSQIMGYKPVYIIKIDYVCEFKSNYNNGILLGYNSYYRPRDYSDFYRKDIDIKDNNDGFIVDYHDELLQAHEEMQLRYR